MFASALRGSTSSFSGGSVQRTLHTDALADQHIRVNPRRAHIFVSSVIPSEVEESLMLGVERWTFAYS